MQLDHVLLAVADLATGARQLAAEHGLEPYEGGRHPGWGTANWIIPLGESYLELIAVVDEDEARESAFGRRVAESAAGPAESPLGWAVRPIDLGATAERLGLEITAGSRTMPSGEVVAWRMAGLDEAVSRPHLPFFLEWSEPTRFPGATTRPVASIERLELECEPDELADWLGKHSLPLHVRPGSGRITAVVLSGPRGTITFGGQLGL